MFTTKEDFENRVAFVRACIDMVRAGLPLRDICTCKGACNCESKARVRTLAALDLCVRRLAAEAAELEELTVS